MANLKLAKFFGFILFKNFWVYFAPIEWFQEQLSNSQRNVHEVQKKIRQLELEKEELQHALDEAEAALEIEESKVQRLQVEVSWEVVSRTNICNN